MFRIRHIRTRIALSVTMILVVAILLTTTIISNFYTKELVRKSALITEQKMNIIINKLEEEIEKVIKLQNIIQEDKDLQNLMLTNKDREINNSEISQLLRDYAYGNISVSSIFAFTMDKEILDPFYKVEPFDAIINNYEPFDIFTQENSHSRFSVPSDFPNPSYNSSIGAKNTITYFSNYIDQKTFLQIGYILINIKKDYIFNEFRRSCEQEFDFVVVVNEKGQTIETVGKVISDKQLLQNIINTETNDAIVTVKNINTYIINQPVESYNNWTVIGGVSYEALNASGEVIRGFVLSIISLSIVGVIIISFVISKRIIKPIIEVTNSMVNVEKEYLPEPLEIESKDELKILVDGYNKMLVDVKTLLAQVQDEQYKKNEFEITNLKLRLELLQSQINPHFVHNTLNGIKYLAIENNTDQLVDVIESFNLLLRSSMSIDTDFVTLEKEVDLIRSFLKIFNIRYDFEVSLNIDIQEGLNTIMIPKLILQPIVENSAYHGILAKGCEGEIKVKVTSINDNTLLIEIIDNGIGMSKENVLNIFTTSEKSREIANKKGFNNVGLMNINERLKLYYGVESLLLIESRLGNGTKVSFTIPLKGRGNNGQIKDSYS